MPQTSQKTENTSENKNVQPWTVQQPYLTDAFQKAQNINNGAAVYSGDQVAQFNPAQIQNFNSTLGFANSSNIPQQSATTGSALTGAGTSAVQSALTGMQNFASTDPTQSNINSASAYANSPYVSGMVDASMRDANRQAYEQDLPAIDRSAALSGNAMSSTRDIQSGIVQRGLAEKAADISANLRGGLYSQGLGLAQGDRAAMLQAMQGAGSLGNSATGTGLDANNNSLSQQTGLLTLGQQAATGLQGADQAALDNSRLKTEYAANSPYDLLAKYYGIVGGNNWGQQSQSTGTSTTDSSSTPSPWQVAGGLLGAAGSFAGMPGLGALSGGLGGFMTPGGAGFGSNIANFFGGSSYGANK